MRLGIDASNLRDGGGLTHLTEILRAADPTAHGFAQVFLWAGKTTLARIESRPWLNKCHVTALDSGIARRTWWQRFELCTLARQAQCDALFVPGGAHSVAFQPVVTMSRNLLPFERHELARYRWTATGLRLLLLRLTQTRTLRHSAGVIFLSKHAHDSVMRVIGRTTGMISIVPHGVNSRFFLAPRKQLSIDRYTFARPFRVLYLSNIDLYKHQWHVAAAITRLRKDGVPVTLDLVGQAYPPAMARLRAVLDNCDPQREFVRYLGPVPHNLVHDRYPQADLCVFASSCENMPNILLEAMASGLPISCSDRGPMPELLGNAGAYFDPEQPADIARVLRDLINSPEERSQLAEAAYRRAQGYSWQRCARETLAFVADVARTSAAPNTLSARV